MKISIVKSTICILCCCSTILVSAQKVGIMTDAPQSVLHVHSEGLIPHPDGLLMLGNSSTANMVGDFNYFQSKYNGNPLNMYLQPDGGNVGIKMPFSTYPFAPLHVYGGGEVESQWGIAMLGRSTTGHMILDFNRIQNGYGANPLTLEIQPDQGDIDMGDGVLFVDRSARHVGIGDVVPSASLEIKGNSDNGSTWALQVKNSANYNSFNVRDDGNVGIGTVLPSYALDVIGSVGLTEKLIHKFDSDTYLEYTPDRIQFYAGNKRFADFNESANSQDNIYLGGNGIDINFNWDLYIDESTSFVGINTSSPDYLLDVDGSMGLSSTLYHNGDNNTFLSFLSDEMNFETGGVNMVKFHEGDNGNFQDYIDFGDNNEFYINLNRNRVGIGTDDPDGFLHIVQQGGGHGIVLQKDNNEWGLGSDPNGPMNLYWQGVYRGRFMNDDGDYQSASDRRLKKNISDMKPVLERVMQLAPKDYHLKTQEDTELKNVGFIAQEVQDLFPESVGYSESSGFYSIDYNDFAVISIKAIQELTDLVKAQQQQIDELKAEVKGFKTTAKNN